MTSIWSWGRPTKAPMVRLVLLIVPFTRSLDELLRTRPVPSGRTKNAVQTGAPILNRYLTKWRGHRDGDAVKLNILILSFAINRYGALCWRWDFLRLCRSYSISKFNRFFNFRSENCNSSKLDPLPNSVSVPCVQTLVDILISSNKTFARISKNTLGDVPLGVVYEYGVGNSTIYGSNPLLAIVTIRITKLWINLHLAVYTISTLTSAW